MDQGTVVLVGRLTRDPKFFGEGDKKRALFSIAFNRGRDDKRKANFIDCIAWGKRADIMRDFSQSNGIFITGDLEQDTYMKKDEPDVKVSRIQVNVSSITATTNLRRTDGDGATSQRSADVTVGADSADIPF